MHAFVSGHNEIVNLLQNYTNYRPPVLPILDRAFMLKVKYMKIYDETQFY